ncbi:Fe3+/spermidine/putrescine ABC transporter ATP-binding protein [Cystobacter fuscus]|uniref:Fe3+/spermidine/putrescine ABC transporter ATP-binding protein n=1 Tax=Cystobacter fuscus TaxID=43 RepID=A0A250JA51_9BACT|nr:ABC transporter ATP-binding protein [Cystobacter fuscus]ATB40804.1 Fe3+/spermidine/putrescine ABC transporter ATP-binding protein [Cystobacter fuscus]
MDAALLIDFEQRFQEGPTIQAHLTLPATPGRVAVLFGPSGAGKTTVLRALAGLARPEHGRILFHGETWCDSSARVFLPPQARRIGFLFQDYALFPHLTAEQNVQFGLAHLPVAERQERSRVLFSLLHLEGLERRGARELSGGQQQRVALARALAIRPRLLLLDEPLSALDAPSREGLRGELRRLLRELGVPTVVVTHDRLEALALGDDLVAMEQGRVCQVGPVADVFNHPAELAVARMTGIETVLPGRVVRREAGLATVEVGPHSLLALESTPGGDAVFVCLRAEDVTLGPPEATPTSARNRLACTVVSLVPEGALVRVALDAGVPLVARVTRLSREELGLAEGRAVTASFKAPAVRLVPRP